MTYIIQETKVVVTQLHLLAHFVQLKITTVPIGIYLDSVGFPFLSLHSPFPLNTIIYY